MSISVTQKSSLNLETEWRSLIEMRKELFLFPDVTIKQILTNLKPQHELFEIDLLSIKELESVPINKLLDNLTEPSETLTQLLKTILSPIVFYSNFTKYFRQLFESDYAQNFNQKRILEWRILSKEPLTLAEIGQILNVSRERVRQIQEFLSERITHWINQEDIEIYIAYLKANDCYYIESELLALVLKAIEHPSFYFDKDIEQVFFAQYKPMIKQAKNILSNALKKNKTLQIDQIKEFAADLSQEWDFSANEIFDILHLYMINKFVIRENMVHIKKISKGDALAHIFQYYYSNDIVDFSNEDSYALFKNRYENTFPTINLFYGGKERATKRITAILDRIDLIVKIDTNRYRLLDPNKLPFRLLEKVYNFIGKEIEKNGFVSNKKIFRNFKDQITELGHTEKSFYYIYKHVFEEDFYFSGRTALRIFPKNSDAITTEEIIKNLIIENNGQIRISDLCEEIGVEEYSITQQASWNNFRIRGGNVYLPLKKKDLSKDLLLDIKSIIQECLSKKGYVLIQEVYDRYRYNADFAKRFNEAGYHDLSDFRSLLIKLEPNLTGHTRILFHKDSTFDMFDVFIKEMGPKEWYQRKDFLDTGEKIGLALVTSNMYFNNFLKDKRIFPLNEDFFFIDQKIQVPEKVLETVDFFINDYFNGEVYLSLSKIKADFYKLPTINIASWSPELVSYIATELLSFFSVEFDVGDLSGNPYILVKEDKYSYKDLVRLEMKSYDGIKTEDKILDFLIRRGLVKSDSKKIYGKFYSKGIFKKNEFGRIFLVENDHEI